MRQSRRLRHDHAGTQLSSSRHDAPLTATLVLIVALFFLLVSPSEVLHFRSFLVSSADMNSHALMLSIANAMNSLNFATNFLLYLGVNAHFRKTLRHILCRSAVMRSEEATPSTRVYRFTSTSL